MRGESRGWSRSLGPDSVHETGILWKPERPCRDDRRPSGVIPATALGRASWPRGVGRWCHSPPRFRARSDPTRGRLASTATARSTLGPSSEEPAPAPAEPPSFEASAPERPTLGPLAPDLRALVDPRRPSRPSGALRAPTRHPPAHVPRASLVPPRIVVPPRPVADALAPPTPGHRPARAARRRPAAARHRVATAGGRAPGVPATDR